jgi:hypothetical protein
LSTKKLNLTVNPSNTWDAVISELGQSNVCDNSNVLLCNSKGIIESNSMIGNINEICIIFF